MKLDLLINPQQISIKTLEKEERVTVVVFNLNKGTTEVNVELNINVESRAYLIVLVRLSGSAELVLKTHQNHFQNYGFSDLLCKSILTAQNKFNFQGTINIAEKTSGNHAYQRNENLLLSAEASVVSEPNLEIKANDVFCTHGATTSFIDEEELFYLQSRGVSQNRAEKLVAEGFLESALKKLIEAGVTEKEQQQVLEKVRAVLR